MKYANVEAILLAAGRSKRFNRTKSKLLSRVCGRKMILFPLKKLEDLGIKTTVVLGYQSEQAKGIIEEAGLSVNYTVQKELLGTGDAVLSSKEHWSKDNILILNGDIPLLNKSLICELIEKHTTSGDALSFVATSMINPAGYGRVVTEKKLIKIFEEKDCPEEHKSCSKVNAGIYIVKKTFLEEFLTGLEKSPVSGEFYLTDLVARASEEKAGVQVILAPFDVVRGVNTLQELWAVEQIMRSNLIKHWMGQGVRFGMAQSIHIDVDVEIGTDSFIGTGVHLLGKTKIGEGCVLHPFSILENTTIGDRVLVDYHSVLQDSTVGNDSKIGPFARLCKKVFVGDRASVGNFVEVKNSTIGSHSKAKHLSYIGDTSIGAGSNIGAGTVVCNYDGQEKYRTIIEENVFIGSNNTIIAPVIIEKDSYTAAGSTITKNVSSGDLAIGRARQENKPGYASKLRKDKKFKKKGPEGSSERSSGRIFE